MQLVVADSKIDVAPCFPIGLAVSHEGSIDEDFRDFRKILRGGGGEIFSVLLLPRKSTVSSRE